MAMFNLFGKKKEQPAPQAAEDKSAHYKAFAAAFLPEERDYLAVTAPSGFTMTKDEESGLFKAGIPLTAWLDEEMPDELHREPVTLTILADQELLGVLRQRMPANFILKFKARPSKEDLFLMLTNLPAPGFDPDLKAILDEQKKPVTVESEQLGTFTLSRTMNWFQTDVDWQEENLLLAFDQEEEAENCFQTAQALLADQDKWDETVRSFVADQLLERANEASEEEDAEEITRDQLLDWISLETILVFGDGRFEFWFNDGGLFMGNPIHVSGSLTDGLSAVQVEG